ncbi:MAG: DUF2586 domain-containing protein [Tannerella sp.]|jgi:hypothetical protein|nr:DUF2586 domain-containing protein [Tannerella sp.]
MNDIIFQKQNGGMGRTAANEDNVSGLIMSADGKLTGAELSEFDEVDSRLYIVKLTYYEQLGNTYLITPSGEPADDADYAKNAIDYHVAEFFRLSPTGILFLAILLEGNVAAVDITMLQNYAEGRIRQAGILTPAIAAVADYQAAAALLETEHKPLSIIFTIDGTKTTVASYVAANANVLAGRCNVSELIGCDLYPALLARLGVHPGLFAPYGCIGALLGAVSKAAVNESVAWVQKFPLSLLMPGLTSGDLVKEIPTGDLDIINGNRYIFVRTYPGDANNYFNDSFTYDVGTSDYAFIENVRTMDKAMRNIRSNLLPFLNAPLYVNASTGRLRADTVAVLETVAGRALEDMEKAGELSGYVVEIDPEQDVLATSLVEIVIRNVPVGVMRKVLVKIGFTTKI